MAIVKIRNRLKMETSSLNGTENTIVKSILEARDIALENKELQFYKLVKEYYLNFQGEEIVIKKEQIESATRGSIELIENLSKEVRESIDDDFMKIAHQEPSKTIIVLPNDNLLTMPSSFNYLIMGNKFEHMCDMVAGKLGF